MTRRGAARALKTAGLVLSLALIGWLLARNLPAFPPVAWADPATVSTLAGALALYVAGMIVSARNWRIVLRAAGVARPTPRAESQVLLGQIGKYLPGNVAQFAGRMGLALKDGLPAAATGAALALEIAVGLIAAVLAAAAAAATDPDAARAAAEAAARAAAALGGAAAPGGVLAAVLAAVLVGALAAGLLGAAAALMLRGRARIGLRAGPLAAAICVQTGAAALQGASFLLAARAVSDDAPSLAVCVAAFAAAQALGIVTPGAPGGLGVREAAIAALLGPLMGEGAAVAAALLHRAVSVAGDGAAALLGLVLRRRSRPAAPVRRADRR